jgi:hypothetical protein
VSGHAIERFKERCPETESRTVVGTIFYEVRTGLDADRRATKAPGWCTYSGTKGNKQTGKIRFVWNEGETRCYPLKRVREGGDAWVVMSTYARRLTDD